MGGSPGCRDSDYGRSYVPKDAQHLKLELFPPRTERRGAPRVVPPEHIRCELTRRKAHIRPKDISATGIAVWADVKLPVGRAYEVEISLDTFSLTRGVRVVYCKTEGADRWLVGMTFLPAAEDDANLDQLIRLIATEFRAD